MKSTALRYFLIVLLLIAFVAAFLQSAQIQQLAGMGDMRNRVVGARLMKDGILPYYHQWYPGDSLRYVNNMIIDTTPNYHRVSNITASPFFHRILFPIADYDQNIIDKGAFLLFNIFFVISLFFALKYSRPDQYHRSLLLLIPLMFTDGWRHHFVTVQYYMLFGFLLTVIALLLLKKQQVWAGVVFAFLFLLRLNTAVFALPFLVYFLSYKRFLVATTASVLIYAIFAFFSPVEKSNWIEFFAALKEHSDMHMGLVPTEKQQLDITPLLPEVFEGRNDRELRVAFDEANFRTNAEFSNFKNGYKALVGQMPPTFLLHFLFMLCVVFTLLRCAIPLKKPRFSALEPFQLVIAGLLLYYFSNFFSTIGVGAYQLPQWWAMAVIYAIYYNKINRISLVFYLAGVMVNFYFMPNFPGKHLVGEMLLLASGVFALIFPRNQYDVQAEGISRHFKPFC